MNFAWQSKIPFEPREGGSLHDDGDGGHKREPVVHAAGEGTEGGGGRWRQRRRVGEVFRMDGFGAMLGVVEEGLI